MLLAFHKYQGTGNDFIMIDDRKKIFPANDMDLVRRLCDRRFGIGADGLILIRNYPELDFEMIYFNSDGTQSLCGNGSRCAIKFVRALKKKQTGRSQFSNHRRQTVRLYPE